MQFTKLEQVRFSHCDPAGIVFYPRYAELCNETVEDWFREAIGVDFHQLHEKLRLGVPAVSLEVQFLRPSTYGEQLSFSLQVLAIGKSSMTLGISACCGEEERVRFRLKVALVSMDSMSAVPIDDAWRTRFSAFLG